MTSPTSQTAGRDSVDEDDYLTMSFAEPAQPVHESSLQRRARQKREVGISYVYPLSKCSIINRLVG